MPKFLLLPPAGLFAPGLLVGGRSAEARQRGVGRDVYSWQVISDDGQPATSTCGLLVCADSSLSFARERMRRSISAPAIVIVRGRNAPAPHKQLDAWLRECRNRRSSLVGIGSGTIVLARAGLAEGRRCAVHWEQFPIFSERFLGVVATQTAFEQDGDLYTCAGGDAPFDMFLDLVDHHHGTTIVNRMCEKAIACRTRSAGDR
nr:AraC family transcriptional regulator [Mesorhizobium sp. M7A.F.Ca.MR.176.00.0.0]